jgi:sugar phosphate isomerase/epimerase
MPLAAFPKCYLDAMLRDHSMSTIDWLRVAAAVPLDGVELYWPAVRHLTNDELLDVRREADRLHLALPLMCASPDFTQPTVDVFEREIADQTRAIEATALLGGSCTRVLSGQSRPAMTWRACFDLVIEAITRLLPIARGHGVTLVIENHFKDYFWDTPEFARHSDTFLAILSTIPVDAPFGVQFDPSNALAVGEDPMVLLESVKDRVVSTAASDRQIVGDPTDPTRRLVVHHVIGQGVIDLDRIFQVLAGVGFEGWVSIEDGDDPVTGVADLVLSADHVRRLMVRHGLS